MTIDWATIIANKNGNRGKYQDSQGTHYPHACFGNFNVTNNQYFTSFHLKTGINKSMPWDDAGNINFTTEEYIATSQLGANLRLLVAENRQMPVRSGNQAPGTITGTGTLFTIICLKNGNWDYYRTTQWNGEIPIEESQLTSGNICHAAQVFVTPDTNTFAYMPNAQTNDYYVIPESEFTHQLDTCCIPIYTDATKIVQDTIANSFDNAININEPANAVELELWRGFSKRKKSTKRPVEGVKINVLLKKDIDIERTPSFVLKTDILDYNYCKFNGMYYYIDKVISLNNEMIQIDCVVDPYATAKTEIQAGTAYIERASFSTNILIPDEINPPSGDIVIEKTDILSLKHNIVTGGGIFYDGDERENPFYIVNIIGDDGLKPIGFTRSQFKSFISQVYDNNFWTNLHNAFYDWRDCIGSATMVPFSPQGYRVSSFKVGNLPIAFTGETVALIDDYQSVWTMDSGTVPITFPSASLSVGNSYMDKSPYSQAILFLPYVGVVPIECDLISDTKNIALRATLDQRTSNISYELFTIDDNSVRHKIGTYSGRCGADVPISSRTSESSGLIPSVALGMANPVAGSIGTTSALLKVNTQINGSFSSYVASNMGNTAWIAVITNKPVDTTLTANKIVKGLPYKKVHSLNVSGYVQTNGAQIPMPWCDEIKEAVNNGLDTGLFIE